MSDAYTDKKQRCIINFLVNFSTWTMFIKFVDWSNFMKTREKLFELLDSIVEEIGEEKVVHVITFNGSNYALVARMLEIYWTPCVAHCIDLMLEDIGKLPNINNTIFNEESLLLALYTFKVMAPLVKVLRLVDGEKKPTMSYIYEAMNKAKESIMKSFNNNEAKYKVMFEIIDRRWNVWSRGRWQWRFQWRRAWFTWELNNVQQFMNIVEAGVLREGVQDSRLWTLDSSGCFSVRSGYQALMDRGSSSHLPNVAAVAWDIKVPPKVKCFIWRLFMGALPTKENLLRRNVIVSRDQAIFPFCNVDIESA
uniref:Reverse transcriptase zinc-binding domain-containing protein n=1 Tax=Cajanus cajan TaxID=3821 RepID=A0A151TSS0_CAJCA|nr:hypothetical protein KK1_009313 [Cajanus cajan]